jgi:hypothetical protein
MLVYPVNDQERELLISQNKPNVCWAACWYEQADSCCIEQYTLDDPNFSDHAAVFATFPQRDAIEVTQFNTFII